ncbi:MAG: hypothetical protein ABI113_08950, partial [Mucilaginibacter sp.]
MKKQFIAFAALCCVTTATFAQEATPPKNTNPITKSRILNVDSAVVTKHQVTIKGKVVPYTATAGSMPIWDADGRP